MKCEYNKGRCGRRAIYRVWGDYEDMWGGSHYYVVDVCDVHFTHFDDHEHRWIGGNKPPDLFPEDDSPEWAAIFESEGLDHLGPEQPAENDAGQERPSGIDPGDELQVIDDDSRKADDR